MKSIRRSRALSIRTRVLTLALVPCIVFLLAGVAGAGYLIFDAAKTKNYFELASEAQRESLPLIVSLQEERRLTLRRLASFGTFQSELIKQRNRTDSLAGAATGSLSQLSEIAPDSVIRAVRQFTALMSELPAMRARVDGGQVSILESFTLYNDIIDQFVDGTKGLAQFAPDAEIAYLQLVVSPLLTSADLMQRSDALAAANLVGGGLNDTDFALYQGQVNSYHLQLESTVPLAEPNVQAQYRKLSGSPAWLRLMSVEDVLLRGGNELPISEDLWRAASSDVSLALMTMLQTQSRHTNAVALSKVNTTLAQSIVAGVLVLGLVIAVFLFALRLSRRLIERLIRLRSETLDLAEKSLPELVEKVRTGADVHVDEIRLRDYGADEIGEVADAFNKAQQTAVAAAVQEAKTREGTNKVFLNIAHRSQVIVHRQLKTLDEAERKQENPEQLELLFQLDHLTTRQRRNAENLIILGGGQPGRRWRNPVSLAEIVRGAAAETEDYARVKTAKLPALSAIGPVVGDLVHLLAELIDNATTFSPPGARVDVRGNVVGRGVVIEIEDQGLGIEQARADDFNNMLANPPDFGIMALSNEPRLGLFVVARLAARHGVSVTLRESAYGGTRAIVLIRNELLGPDSAAGPDDDKSEEQKAKPNEPKTETHLRPMDLPATFGEHTAPGPTTRMTIPGAVNLPDLPPLPMVEPRPGEDLFRPQRPVGSEHEPSRPLRPQRPPTTGAEPDSPLPKRPVNGDAEPGRPGLPKRSARSEHEPSQALHREPRHAEKPEPSEPQPAVELRQVAPEINRPAPRDADTRQQAQPQPQAAPTAPGRPDLPQRRRQQNIAPQLKEEAAPEWPQSAAHAAAGQDREDSPDQARSRLAAFQAGTRRGRDEPEPDETLTGNDWSEANEPPGEGGGRRMSGASDETVGSTRNGQHRSE